MIRSVFIVLLAVCGALFFSADIARATSFPADLIVCPDTKISAASVYAARFGAAVGEQQTFQVEASFDSSGRSSITATLRAVGTRSLVYVEDAYFATLSASSQQAVLSGAAALQAEFDSVIYPGLTAFYGFPAEPGVDGDSRITILVTKLITNAGGYVDTTDAYLKTQAPTSNEREMAYLNIQYIAQARRINSFAAHEFTHLIDFNQKKKLRAVEDEVWFNELRAEYAPTQLGYDAPYSGSNLASRVTAFLTNPSDSVTEWKNVEADYGSVNLFGHYLAGRYGVSVLAASMQTSTVGISALDQALTLSGVTDRFSDIAQFWAVANFIQSTQPGAQYAYAQPDLSSTNFPPVNPTTAVSVGSAAIVTVSRQIEDWSGQWIQAVPVGNGNDRMLMTINASVPLRASVVLRKADGTREVRAFTATTAGATLTVDGVTTYPDLTVVPIFMGKTSGFSSGNPSGTYPDEPLRSYSITFQRIASDAPLLSSITPSKVFGFGGTEIVLRGSGFSKGTPAVTIDGQAVASTVVNDSELQFIAPSHQVGAACVRVVVNAQQTERCDLLSFVAFNDGTLLRGESAFEVWIVRGKFRRHIVRPDILNFYPHLSFSNVVAVPQEVIVQLKLSAWVRLPLTADPASWRIHEINGDASKHWITCANSDQCGPTWIARGGDPDGIFTVNRQEMNFYVEGPRVFLQ